MRATRLCPLVHGLLLATIVGIAGCGGGGGGYSNTMPAEPDLAIAKTHVGNFTVGANGAFTLTVSNVGAGATAATITVTDNVRAELTVVSASGTGWDCSATVGQNVSCSHPGPLAAAASLPALTLTVTPTTATGSPFGNTASVSTAGDGNAANNTSSDGVTVNPAPPPDLTIVKTHAGNFTAGVNGAFTLTVSNVGAGATAAAITVTDSVPAELTAVAASGTGWNCPAPVGQSVSCSHPGPLAPGASLPALTLDVIPNTAIGSPFTNTASVSTAGDGNAANDAASDVVTVNPGAPFDLMILKTHVGNFTTGVNGAFTLTVTNVGGTPAFGTITVTDSVPAALPVISASGTGWNCSATAGQNVSCSHTARLFPAASLPALTLTVTPNTTTGSPFTNIAVVSAAGDSSAGNNTASDAVTVVAGGGGGPGPDLTIVKSHLTNFVVGVNGVYRFRVGNVGSAATSAAISITDTLQTGLAFVSASSTDTDWDCSASAGVNASCSHPGLLAAGASLADLNVTVSVGVAAGNSTFNNVASVATAGDTNNGNNTSVDSTTVTATAQPDLAITKFHTGTFAVGNVETYTIRVRNAGSAATTGAITVTDSLQTGLTLVSATGTNWMCGAAGQTVTCNYQMPPATAPNPNEVLPDITLTVNVGAAAHGVFNNVAVVATPGDNNPANDTAVDQTIVQ